MKTVTVNKDELLKIVTANRDKHRSIFLEAQEGYRQEAIRRLEERLQVARDGKFFGLQFNMIEPMDMTKEYDRVISMLEMSVDNEIELDQQSYAAYVMDDWSWRRQWVAANSAYTVIE